MKQRDEDCNMDRDPDFADSFEVEHEMHIMGRQIAQLKE